MKLNFIKFYIVDALKPLYPEVKLGKRDYSKECLRNLVPEDYVYKNCSTCKYREWELKVFNDRYYM